MPTRIDHTAILSSYLSHAGHIQVGELHDDLEDIIRNELNLNQATKNEFHKGIHKTPRIPEIEVSDLEDESLLKRKFAESIKSISQWLDSVFQLCDRYKAQYGKEATTNYNRDQVKSRAIARLELLQEKLLAKDYLPHLLTKSAEDFQTDVISEFIISGSPGLKVDPTSIQNYDFIYDPTKLHGCLQQFKGAIYALTQESQDSIKFSSQINRANQTITISTDLSSAIPGLKNHVNLLGAPSSELKATLPLKNHMSFYRASDFLYKTHSFISLMKQAYPQQQGAHGYAFKIEQIADSRGTVHKLLTGNSDQVLLQFSITIPMAPKVRP